MSKGLTERIKVGFYYALLYQYDGEHPDDRDFDDIVRYCGDGKFEYDGCYDGVQKVLAPVPSYEEYRELLRHSELSRNLVYEVLVNQKEYNELLDKAKEYKRLEKKLEIAIKALKELETKSDKFYGCNDWSMQEQLDFIKAKCQETLYQLEEMEGVK